MPIALLMWRHSTLYDGIRHVLFVIPVLGLLAGGALVRLASFLSRPWMVAGICAAAVYVGAAIANFVLLHPLEYVAVNLLAGGVRGAYGRFELDYWSAAGTEPLRRLEHLVDAEAPGLVIDKNHQIVRFSGGAVGQYLEPSAGTPSFNLFDILRKALRPIVRSALQGALARKGPVTRDDVRLRIAGQSQSVTVIVEPISDARNAEEWLCVIVFQHALSCSRQTKNLRLQRRKCNRSTRSFRPSIRSWPVRTTPLPS
jgi:hypothetical protein